MVYSEIRMKTTNNSNINISYSTSIFKADTKLKTFYNLIIKEIASSGREMSNEHVWNNEHEHVEYQKHVFQISQKLHSKHNFYASYICRTVTGFMLAAGLLCFLGAIGIPAVLQVITNQLFRLLCFIYIYIYIYIT